MDGMHVSGDDDEDTTNDINSPDESDFGRYMRYKRWHQTHKRGEPMTWGEWRHKGQPLPDGA